MKVVLFCGGQGMRIRPMGGVNSDGSDAMPKPMVPIGGQRPMLWHVMKYYAHFGHKDFILCLGYGAELIKQYFLNYNEHLTNDFVMSNGGADIELLSSDIHDWRITFVDTGLYSNIGERLRRARPWLEGEDMFLANYSDGLTDVPFDDYMGKFLASGATAGFVSVRPPQTSHVVEMREDGIVTGIRHIREGVWINGGYFILRSSIFDLMNENEELVHEPFQRLVEQQKLFAYQYKGFWTCIDTFKEKQELDEMYTRGHAPWQVWARQEA